MDASEGFDRLYAGVCASQAYRDAVRAAAAGLPEWVVPFSAVDAPLLERIVDLLSVPAGAAILDVGCGLGGIALWIAERSGCSVLGADVSARAVAEARALATRRGMELRVHFAVASAAATELPDESIDAAVSIDVLMFADASSAAKELMRVLRPGGRIALTSVESIGEPFAPTILSDHRPVFEAAGFQTLVHEALPEHHERQLVLYRALVAREDDLREEMGDVADDLLEEAQNGINRAETGTVRVRHVLYAGQRPTAREVAQ